MDIEISVIVCTYNSNKDKIMQTLYSIVNQENVDMNIVISDDGSTYFPKEEIEVFFRNYNYNNYQIIRHKTNQGTVKNILDALLNSDGEYVFLTSPGDYLYDEYSLRKILDFIKQNNCDFCFGKHISYSIADKEIILHKNKNPQISFFYSPSFKFSKIINIAFFTRQQPVGACFVRKRDVALKYINLVSSKIKYVEDYSTTALYLLDGNKLFYYNKPFVFYEVGTGISTSGSSMLNEDIKAISDLMVNTHPNDRIVATKYKLSGFSRLKNFDIAICALIIRLIGNIVYFFKKKPKNRDAIVRLKSIINMEKE